jgi:hypothetical protein
MAMSSLAYLEQVLCPQLIPGQVVIVDKLAAHKVAGVKALMERLSPSPLLHPILRTSIHRASLVQIKQLLHAAKAPQLGGPGIGHCRGLGRCPCRKCCRLV